MQNKEKIQKDITFFFIVLIVNHMYTEKHFVLSTIYKRNVVEEYKANYKGYRYRGSNPSLPESYFIKFTHEITKFYLLGGNECG